MAVMEELTYCSPQNTSPKGMVIMVKLSTRMAFHCRSSRGHLALRIQPQTNNIPAAKTNRMAAALNGGTSRTTTRMASQVLLHTMQRKMYPKSCARFKPDMKELV